MHNASKNSDLLPEGKWCPGCEKARKIDKFYALKDGHFYSYCIDCSRQRNKAKYKVSGRNEKRRVRQQELHWLRAFSITEQQYSSMLESQNGVCAACGYTEIVNDYRTKLPKKLAVDHCHITNQVRGLLCNACNISLGLLEDNIERIHALELYLLKYQEKSKELS